MPARNVYILVITYMGMPSNAERLFECILNKPYDGSGFGFGARDISFYYYNKKSFIAARRKLYKAKSKGIKLPKFVTEMVII